MKLPPVDLPNTDRETIRKAIETLRAALEKDLEELRRRVKIMGG